MPDRVRHARRRRRRSWWKRTRDSLSHALYRWRLMLLAAVVVTLISVLVGMLVALGATVQ